MFAAKTFNGKRVAVFGLGRTGLACIEALQLGGAQVLAFDDNGEAVEKGKADGLPIVDLHQTDFATLDAYVLSPGVPLTHPEPHWSVKKARAAGIEIIGDTEVFARELAGTGAKIVAITGTNGKSTTTALIGHMLEDAGVDVEIGGNIGMAVFLLGAPVKDKVYVLELSSYQLDLSPGLKADIAILMNLSPDHIDRHGSMDNYAAVKARIFAGQGDGDTAILSVDDKWCRAVAPTLSVDTQIIPVSVHNRLENGISAVDGILIDGDISIDLSHMRALKGEHNWQNACAAYAAGKALGLSVGQLTQGLQSFSGLVHRMEEVGRINGVSYINDSKATNADAAARALATFEPIYWIAGGRSKQGGIESLKPYFKRMAHAYLIGESAEDFALTLNGDVPVDICGTLDKALKAASCDALKEAKPGTVVLLSPACASFDQYRSFDIRGDEFRSLVSELDGIELNEGVSG